MTERYDLLIASINATNLYLMRMALFAFFGVIAFPVLSWVPAWMRRPAQYIYLASLLILFLSTVLLSGLVI